MRRGVVVFLTILPLWLFVSTGVGLWLWNRGKEAGESVESEKFRTPITADGLAGDLRKIIEVAGPRHVGSERGATGLRRVAAMIRGSLGPENAGYSLEVHPGPETEFGSWPVVIARLPGEGEGIAVLAAYDAEAGDSGLEFNATGVASVMALAQSMAGQVPGRPVSFVFMPHGYDRNGPVEESCQRMRRRLGGVDLLLVVEATGASGRLMVSALDPGLLPRFEGRVRIVDAEVAGMGVRSDLATVLEGLGAPAVRVSTRGLGEGAVPDVRLPDPSIHATATLELAELVARLASRSAH